MPELSPASTTVPQSRASNVTSPEIDSGRMSGLRVVRQRIRVLSPALISESACTFSISASVISTSRPSGTTTASVEPTSGHPVHSPAMLPAAVWMKPSPVNVTSSPSVSERISAIDITRPAGSVTEPITAVRTFSVTPAATSNAPPLSSVRICSPESSDASDAQESAPPAFTVTASPDQPEPSVNPTIPFETVSAPVAASLYCVKILV